MTPVGKVEGDSVNSATHTPGGPGPQAQGTSPPGSFHDATEDAALVERLRKHDEAAFLEIVQRYHGSLARLAQSFVNSRAAAEDAAQETWVGVLQGLGNFEGRSSLKTWIFQILINRAKTRGVREARSIPFSAFWNPNADPAEPAVSPERFRGSDDEWPDHWATPPQSWGLDPERRLLAQETRELIQKAIEALPASQREVITLRDVEGWTADEVCNILGVSETNQRVLLHRARSKVRSALEKHLERA